MSTATISAEEHKRQIEAYQKEYPTYKLYADALKRVLEHGCAGAIPEALVQARPKGVASFAEKCVRKYDKYRDAVNQMTDLCGGRVILPTLEHVQAVKLFIERNFVVVERDDKSGKLGEGEFGYRDMHYLLRLHPERAALIGFTEDERTAIGQRVAEVQVRSLVQHAWADILHDRMYKAPLKLTAEARRTGALLAAIMEEGDRNFNLLADQLDGMFANYSAYTNREHIEDEIRVQELLLQNISAAARPAVALRLARLRAGRGEWAKVHELLQPLADTTGMLGLPLRLELGHALCRLHHGNPASKEYAEGQELLQQVVAGCQQPDLLTVPDLRRLRGLQSRALARLGWSWEAVPGEAHEARDCYRLAAELEPGNPYYLTEMLGFEITCGADLELVGGFRAPIRAALATCRQHMLAGTELPVAFFTATRLNLLLGDPNAALNNCAAGIRHLLTGEGCLACDFLGAEKAWLFRMHFGRTLPEEYRWVRQLLELAAHDHRPVSLDSPAVKLIRGPVLMIAGGAENLNKDLVPRITALLTGVLAEFKGTVISGGTTSGVPGCVGAVAAELTRTGRKQFTLLGYIPKAQPDDAVKDHRYDHLFICGTDHFTPAQVLESWTHVLAAGVKPEDVTVLGLGGGKISAFEYRLGLALNATVGVLAGENDAAADLLKDPLWQTKPGPLALPEDARTLRALVVRNGYDFSPEVLEQMGREFHERYRQDNLHKAKPDNLKPWKNLPATYRTANLKQAAYSVRILEAAGFDVRPAAGKPVIFTGFTDTEIELMAELEHGRWNIERLLDGWQYGQRDDEKKHHNCLVPWTELTDGPEGVKKYDRDAVRAFPEILATGGLEVHRR